MMYDNSRDCVVVRDFFTEQQAEIILKHAKNIHNTVENMKYYENVNSRKLLSRIENFYKKMSKEFKDIIETSVKPFIESVYQDKFSLFKDKLNYKLPGGGAFTPHQDHPAWSDFPAEYYATTMFFIDDHTIENGCIQFSSKTVGNKLLDFNELNELNWKPLTGSCRDLAIFNSFIPHKSEQNTTSLPRRAMFLTWCSDSYGDLYDEYFIKKRIEFPPESDRIPGKVYDSVKYNLANPFS